LRQTWVIQWQIAKAFAGWLASQRLCPPETSVPWFASIPEGNKTPHPVRRQKTHHLDLFDVAAIDDIANHRI
jgi:hypothetical protein